MRSANTPSGSDSLIADLRRAAADIRILHDILPICASCKKIRPEHGTWKSLETHFNKHPDTQFIHGLCPACGARALGEAREGKKRCPWDRAPAAPEYGGPEKDAGT